MSFTKTIVAQSSHTLFIEEVELRNLPENVQNFQFIDNYEKHYVVHNWDKNGYVFMYLATDRFEGTRSNRKQIVVWYSSGSFWSSFGTTLEKAINGAQKDGWMYA